jgi:hypothetical protein
MMRKVRGHEGKLTLRLKSSFDPSINPRGKTPGLVGGKLATILDDREASGKGDLFSKLRSSIDGEV